MSVQSEIDEVASVSVVPAFIILSSIVLVLVAACGTLLGYSLWGAVGFSYAVTLTGSALIMVGFGFGALAWRAREPIGYGSQLTDDDALIFSLCPDFGRSELRPVEIRSSWPNIIESWSYVELQRCLMKHAAGTRIVVIDDESFDLYELVEKLLSLRVSFPDVKVILLSGSVSGDDFSATRAPICDVTLKKPISPKRLASAMECVGA